MLAVTMREDRGDGKRGRRMSRRKARTRAAETLMTVEKSIGEIAVGRDVRRTQPPRRHLHCHVDDGAVGVCFSRQQRGVFREGIVPEISHDQKSRRNTRHYC